jgi:hypothetical protein
VRRGLGLCIVLAACGCGGGSSSHEDAVRSYFHGRARQVECRDASRAGRFGCRIELAGGSVRYWAFREAGGRLAGQECPSTDPTAMALAPPGCEAARGIR